MKGFLRCAPWSILLISFAVLAYFYHALPNEILLARSVFGSEATFAPKSLFTVFRVPLIETVCAAAVEVMRRRAIAAENCSIASMWSVLLYTVSLKSVFQSLETVSTASSANTFFSATIGVVALGIAAALFVGRNFFSKSSRAARQLNARAKAILAALLIGYLGLAVVPVLVYK